MSESLLARIRAFGSAEAVVVHGRSHDYRSLVADTERWMDRLAEAGVGPGAVVALRAGYGATSCAVLIALVELGAIVVPMSDLLPAARTAEFADVAEVEFDVEVDVRAGTAEIHRTGRAARHLLYDRLRDRRSPGLVLFSSGTTGRSKASVLDFGKLIGQLGLRSATPRRTLAFLTLDHIGGINTVVRTLGVGGSIVTIAERTPDAVFAAIERHRVQVLPTTPTFLNMVLISEAWRHHDLGSLDLVTYGTEPMPAGTLVRLADALPDVRLKQTYGLTEVGILPTRSRSDDSLWVELGGPGFEYEVRDDILWVRSDTAMLGYLNAPAPFDDDGFFDTQDVVETDGRYVLLRGRRSEIINVGGEKVYPAEVENVVLQVGNVAEATVSGTSSPVLGAVVVANVWLRDPEDERSVTSRVREHCRRLLEPFKVPAAVTVMDGPAHSERMKKVRVGA